MSYLRYFPHIAEFSELMQRYLAADPAKRRELLPQLGQAPSMREWKREQEFFRLNILAEWEKGQMPFGVTPQVEKKIEYKTQDLKHDFYITLAVPGSERPTLEELDWMPYHRHNYLELIYVAEGHYVQYINGKQHEHRQGDFCLMNPNVVHRDLIAGPGDVVIFFCLGQNFVSSDLVRAFSPHPELKNFMSYQSGRSSRQYIQFHPQDPAAIGVIVEQILRENYEKQPGHHLVIHGLLVRLFCLLVRPEGYTIFQQDPSRIEEYLTPEIVQYINDHLRDVTREQIAACFHFNPDYINRLLQRSMGKSYSEYVHELRLNRAAHWLLHSAESVNSIIRECGYNNKGYFNRLFQEKFGMLPGEYRKAGRESDAQQKKCVPK